MVKVAWVIFAVTVQQRWPVVQMADSQASADSAKPRRIPAGRS